MMYNIKTCRISEVVVNKINKNWKCEFCNKNRAKIYIINFVYTCKELDLKKLTTREYKIPNIMIICEECMDKLVQALSQRKSIKFG